MSMQNMQNPGPKWGKGNGSLLESPPHKRCMKYLAQPAAECAGKPGRDRVPDLGILRNLVAPP